MAPIHGIGADHNHTYDYLKRIDARKSEYEGGRLLYVATTRARSELHLLGHTGLDVKDGAVKLKQPESSSLLKRMWSIAKPAFETVLPAATPAATITETEREPQAIQRLIREWRLPALPASVAAARPFPANEGAEPPVSFRWVGDTLRHIGTVVHQMLRRIAQDGAAAWNAARIEQQWVAYGSALLALGVPAADLSAAVERIAAALHHTLEDERGRWLLSGEHASAACEYSLGGISSGEIVDVRIDRTFVDKDGTRWIIDYKSSSHDGSGVDTFLDNERERYRGQLERYRGLFTVLEDRPVRMGLYFPLVRGWREVEELPRGAESGNSST